MTAREGHHRDDVKIAVDTQAGKQGTTARINHAADGQRGATAHLRVRRAEEPRQRGLVERARLFELQQLGELVEVCACERTPARLLRVGHRTGERQEQWRESDNRPEAHREMIAPPAASEANGSRGGNRGSPATV